MLPEVTDFDAMGVRVRVGGATALEAAAVRDLFEEWERAFSRFRPDSELSRINRHAHEVVVVSPLFARVTRVALQAAAATVGRVDPTLGGAIEAAGYDRDISLLPDDAPAARPSQPGCWQRLRLDGCLLYRPRGVLIDLNCVVKAMAVDAALELLAGNGYASAGGDLAVRGTLDVELPGGGAVAVHSSGVATSGSSRKRWMRGGAVQHHLLDPRTGRPARSLWSDVTVAAADCTIADVAAKTAFLLSGEGPGWIEEQGLAARFLAEDGEIVDVALAG
jgi:thiamine biosynthesis lipoprotein